MRTSGFTLIELMLVVAIIGILALIAIPNFISLRQKAYDASAKSVGYSVKVTEEVFYNDTTDSFGSYTTNLDILLGFDRNLTDDPAVTFLFISADKSGFTVATRHAMGSQKWFTYHD